MARRTTKSKAKPAIEIKENIVPVDIASVMRGNYGDYAAAVVISRAIPDVRDGLKPVHRRILYGMKAGGYDWTGGHRKSARIVGEVMGKFHPHGDSSIYDAMARLTQVWQVTTPLIDGQGNFGSPDGDSPAAMRYTEARLSPVAKHLLGEINRETVGFKPNYDGLESEPTVLPAAFPNILVNGGSGIAVGMSSSFPPHNIGEVSSAAIARLRNPDLSLQDLMEIIPGPDLPTAGIIVGNTGILNAYESGRGTIQVEATAHYEMDGKTPVIIYTDMPYGVEKPTILGQINDLIKAGKLPQVISARDESDRHGTRFVVEMKPGSDQENTDLFLKTQTALRTTISLNFTALNGQGVPREMGLIEILDNWIGFRRETVRKRCIFDLRKARNRGRLILGRIAALTVIDRIVKKIKESPDRSAAIAAICAMSFPSEDFGELLDLLGTNHQRGGKRFNLSEYQADDILSMRLQRLTGMERKGLEDEGHALALEIKKFQEILASEHLIDDIINAELTEIITEYSTPRKTKIDVEAVVKKVAATKISEPKTDCFVEISPQGLIQTRKKLPEEGEDAAGEILVANSHSRLVVFTDTGTAYGLDVSSLPRLEEKKEDPRSINGLLGQQTDGAVASMLVLDSEDLKKPDEGGALLVFTTCDGFVRRTAASEFATIPSTGKLAMKVSGNDAPILNVLALKGDDKSSGMFLGTANGKAIRFSLDQVRIFGGRASRGVRGIKIDADDIIVSAILVPLSDQDSKACDAIEDSWLKSKSRDDLEMVQVATTGHIKRTTLHAYRQMNRDGKGVNDKGPAKTIGQVVKYLLIKPTDTTLSLSVGPNETVAIDITDVRKGSRASTGGKPVNTATDIRIQNT